MNSLKAKYGTLKAAKEALGIKARSWAALAMKLKSQERAKEQASLASQVEQLQSKVHELEEDMLKMQYLFGVMFNQQYKSAVTTHE